ncbi:hypothetical protein [Ferruginibacter sp.]|uniref:hypothetical protein n=1 Tax=Ferruginibacter sp. TaxID=1940288 RepID=UPI002658F1F2|nr:hypothetical protein [Ferruginibacter sp.]
MKKIIMIITVCIFAGQLMAQTTQKLAPPPKAKMVKAPLTPPPPPQAIEINELPPPPPPPLPKHPQGHNEKVHFVAPKIIKDKEN